MKQETFEINEFEIDSTHRGPTVRVAFMSDFHLGQYTARRVIDAAVTACQAQKPDAVLLGGDYISGPYDLPFVEPLAEAFSQLKTPLGVFYVLGNHDYWSGPDAVCTAFDSHGFTNVTNRNVALSQQLRLCGIDDSWEGKPDIDAALANTQPGQRLVLSHNPKIFNRLQQHSVVAICGHTHGGQIRIPLIPNPALLTGKYPYIKGWYSGGTSRLYVNRGIGTVILPYRINCPPEITILRLPVLGNQPPVGESG